MADLDEAARALRALAAVLRSGASLRQALEGWHRDAPGSLEAPLARLGRRLRLGESPQSAIASLQGALGDAAPRLAAAVALHFEAGADLSSMLDALAASLDRRRAALAAARAACAGLTLSGRFVSGLPLAFLPVMPLARVPLLDPPGLIGLCLGLALAGAGMWWMGRLLPRPEALEDPVAELAELIAAGLRGGVGAGAALAASMAQASEAIRPAVQRALRAVRLGAPWPEALLRSQDEGLTALGAILREAEATGVPLADRLCVFAEARRAERSRLLDAATRRAPVLMALPLVLCVLPSFLILGLGPFLRGLWLTS